MAGSRYVALLRGINVGGRNIIGMADLRTSFEAMGLAAVQTYIQSGNVVFSTRGEGPAKSPAKLTLAIERTLSETFAYTSTVVLVSARDLGTVAMQAPRGFGQQPDKYRYDVIFPKAPLTAAEALTQLSAKPGVDALVAGDHALYFRRLTAKASQSHLVKLTQLPVYQRTTVRNWNTTTRLLEMVRGGA